MHIRQCVECGNTKDLNSANFRKRESRGRTYYYRACLVCTRIKGRDTQRAYRSNPSPEIKTGRALKKKNIRLKYEFGIDLDEYNKHLALQNGVCAICKQPEQASNRALAIDHSHSTEEIRGLLCGRCNQGIGRFLDSPSLLREAALYLETTDFRIRKAA